MNIKKGTFPFLWMKTNKVFVCSSIHTPQSGNMARYVNPLFSCLSEQNTSGEVMPLVQLHIDKNVFSLSSAGRAEANSAESQLDRTELWNGVRPLMH